MSKNNYFLTLMESAKPIDPTTHLKANLLQKVRDYPELKESFERQCTDDFKREVERKGVYFILNKVSHKMYTNFKPALTLGTCCREKLPTISIDY